MWLGRVMGWVGVGALGWVFGGVLGRRVLVVGLGRVVGSGGWVGWLGGSVSGWVGCWDVVSGGWVGCWLGSH